MKFALLTVNKYSGFSQIFIGCLTAVLLFACHSKEKHEQLIVAVSANASYAMEELAKEFYRNYSIKPEIIVGSSGQLTAQIIAGAHYDIFVSADMDYPRTLFKKGLALDSPEVYGYGSLVVWSMDDIILPDIQSILHNRPAHLALANPKTAPYGKAAVAALHSFDVYDSLKSTFVFGENISQVTGFLLSGSADVGLTAKSVVLAPSMKGKGKWQEIPSNYYPVIMQGMVRLSEKEEAKTFYRFMSSQKSKEILKKYGYRTKLEQ